MLPSRYVPGATRMTSPARARAAASPKLASGAWSVPAAPRLPVVETCQTRPAESGAGAAPSETTNNNEAKSKRAYFNLTSGALFEGRPELGDLRLFADDTFAELIKQKKFTRTHIRRGRVCVSHDYLIIDRDPLYTSEFRSAMKRGRVEVIRLPPSSPNLNAFAERASDSGDCSTSTTGKRRECASIEFLHTARSGVGRTCTARPTPPPDVPG